MLAIAFVCLQSAGASASEAGGFAEQLRKVYARAASFDVTSTVTWSNMGRYDKTGGRAVLTGLERTPVSVSSLHIRQLSSGTVCRFDFLEAGEVVKSTIQDTAKAEQIDYLPKQGLFIISRPDLMVFSSSVDYRVPWLHAIGRIPIQRLLLERPQSAYVREGIGWKISAGYPTERGANLGPFRFVWRFRDAGEEGASSCEVFQARQEGEVAYSVHEVLERKKHASGPHVPIKIRSREFATIPEFSGKLLNEYVLEVDQGVSKWFSEPAMDLLRISPPPGTKVQDQIRRLTYTQGEANPQRHLDALGQRSSDVLKLAKQGEATYSAPPIQSESLRALAPWWRSTSAYVAYIVLLVSFSFILYRRRQLAAE